MRFQLAVGSYGEVLHWLDRELIDVAVLTPGVFAGLLQPNDGRLDGDSVQYLATVLMPAAKTRWASTARREEGRYLDRYCSSCLVRSNSALQNAADLRRVTAEGRAEFLFVHPLSLSGHVVPLEALRTADIDVSAVPRRFTYSHSQSIRMLRSPISERERVAFVWDDAAGVDRLLEEGVRKLPFPELDRLEIPHDVVIARRDYPRADRLKSLLLSDFAGEQRYRFVHTEDWRTRFGDVRDWLVAAGVDTGAGRAERSSLDEIGHLLLQYARSQPQPPRVALVLSGGGAKCSYQVGAVSAIEQRLEELRRENPQHPIDIDLVVGTSGGAINALPIAMGISRTETGRQSLRETWEGLDQRKIVRPPPLVRIIMGIWFACVQTALIVLIVRWRVPKGYRRGWVFAAVYTLLAAVEIVLGYTAPRPWDWLGSNHLLHHAYLWLSFGVHSSAWSLFAIGLGALVLQAVRVRRGERISLPRRLSMTVLLALIFGLPFLLVVVMLHFEETLSGGQGMEQAMTEKLPRLINQHLQQQNAEPLQLPTKADPRSTLQGVSRQIIERDLVTRDLVLTGSCLENQQQQLPPDLYFYASANPVAAETSYGDHGLSLRQHPEVLLDVVLGSGSIYPVFPARRIANLPHDGEQIELIDGGYAHNSPIEAAVMWGATHMILIDVTPRGEMKRGSLFLNLLSSVRHLHRQAQLLDTRSRGKITIFTLSPEPPHICIIDFANNLIAASIEKGYRDATDDGILAPPQFQRELGEPSFVEVRSDSF